jgi:maleate isomerase
MTKRILLGMLTPSSNTILEPVTCAMIGGLPNVSAHFSRFTVTEISLKPKALGQFDDTKILEAAKLLADAKVDVIAWNGTSAGWLGFESDEHLCERITAATGIPATTSVLALNEIMRKAGVKDFGLVSPYTSDVQEKIIANYRNSGFNCVGEQHSNLHVNFEFSEVTEDQIRQMFLAVARNKPQAITTLCTNLNAAHLAEELEQKTGVAHYDSIATVVWKSLQIAGYDTRQLKGWGSLFRDIV